MPRRSNYRLLFGLDILLDLVCEGRPQHAEANKVIELCNGEGDMGFVAAASLKDAYRIFCKQYGEESARRAVGFLMNLLIIVPLSAEECDIALRSDEPDFGDGLIRACAELNDIDFILTRNESAFAHSKIRSLDCADYLEIACNGD
ncbi:MAG: PIN domain-containing protein [Atopobiaceae bacterium]|jgi:hypothetical protein|uniref:type II toxin-antitoxin system VapC family toxin n=1 Tax=Atopobiaceae TaxID=1643824 RepID=UPI003A8F1BC2|nr:PIN domain-containing protein [Atopobiaceae bacterium]